MNVGALGFPDVIDRAFQRPINRQIIDVREMLAEQGLELQLTHVGTREREVVLAATVTLTS